MFSPPPIEPASRFWQAVAKIIDFLLARNFVTRSAILHLQQIYDYV
jgi:hypothetical protein